MTTKHAFPNGTEAMRFDEINCSECLRIMGGIWGKDDPTDSCPYSQEIRGCEPVDRSMWDRFPDGKCLDIKNNKQPKMRDK